MNTEKILKEKQGTIIDVRTPGEFNGGNVPGSINIPLRDITQKIDELKKLNSPIVLCCASGARSASAKSILKSNGFSQVYNGGSWISLKNKI